MTWNMQCFWQFCFCSFKVDSLCNPGTHSPGTLCQTRLREATYLCLLVLGVKVCPIPPRLHCCFLSLCLVYVLRTLFIDYWLDILKNLVLGSGQYLMKNFHYNCHQNTSNFQLLIMFYRETIQFLYLCNLVYLKFTLSLKEIVLNLCSLWCI